MRKKLTPEEAEALLPDGGRIHVFVAHEGELFGGEWPRQSVIERFRSVGVELAGDHARLANHGIVSEGQMDTVFFQTRLEKKNA